MLPAIDMQKMILVLAVVYTIFAQFASPIFFNIEGLTSDEINGLAIAIYSTAMAAAGWLGFATASFLTVWPLWSAYTRKERVVYNTNQAKVFAVLAFGTLAGLYTYYLIVFWAIYISFPNPVVSPGDVGYNDWVGTLFTGGAAFAAISITIWVFAMIRILQRIESGWNIRMQMWTPGEGFVFRRLENGSPGRGDGYRRFSVNI